MELLQVDNDGERVSELEQRLCRRSSHLDQRLSGSEVLANTLELGKGLQYLERHYFSFDGITSWSHPSGIQPEACTNLVPRYACRLQASGLSLVGASALLSSAKLSKRICAIFVLTNGIARAYQLITLRSVVCAASHLSHT